MNGISLIMLGIVLFTLAYFLRKFQSKLTDITTAVDKGFATIEQGITDNLLKRGTGALDVVTSTLTQVSGVFNQVGDEVLLAKSYVRNDVVGALDEFGNIIGNDIATPLNDAGIKLVYIGGKIDVAIPVPLNDDWHPFAEVAQPFNDTGTYLQSIANKCWAIETSVSAVESKLIRASLKLNDVSTRVKSISTQVNDIIPYVDTNFRNGVTLTITELEHARTNLDSLLLKIVNNQWIAGLAAAGITLIIAGAAIGI